MCLKKELPSAPLFNLIQTINNEKLINPEQLLQIRSASFVQNHFHLK